MFNKKNQKSIKSFISCKAGLDRCQKKKTSTALTCTYFLSLLGRALRTSASKGSRKYPG